MWKSTIESVMDKATKSTIDENDIPGASLCGRDPNALKIPNSRDGWFVEMPLRRGRKPNLFYGKYRVTQR